tara:strand:+ start:253 stop:1161 length:909 start_codon:yes stop_codon:yes gene_type:complete
MSNVLSKEATMNNKDKQEAERKYLHKVYEETKAENKKLGKEVGELKKFIRRFISVSPKDLSVKTPEDYVKDLNEFLEDREALQMTVEVQEEKVGELKAENKQLKEFINSLMTEEQKDICNGEAMELGEPTLQTPKDWIDRLRMFLEERDSLAQAVEDLEEEEGRLELENKKLKETNQLRFDKIKEMENEVGVSKLVHHQNMGLLEDIKKLKDCNYEEYCELVGGENKLIKEFEDLKNEIGELKEEKEKLNFQVDALDKQATELCLKNTELKEQIAIMWEVGGEGTNFEIQVNKRLHPENFED